MRLGLLTVVLGLLAGCVAVPNIATYDFGLPSTGKATTAHLPAPLALVPVAAPSWLNGSDIVYRLSYQDPARPRTYSLSRWVAPPATLFAQRLRQRLDSVGSVVSTSDGVTAQYLLRTELEEFSQVFDAPDSSRASVRLRAMLIDAPSRSLLAQRTFSVERSVLVSDATGGVRGLSEASEGVMDGLLEWLGGEMNRLAKNP
jgi:cholesterol transport system auxiliary component